MESADFALNLSRQNDSTTYRRIITVYKEALETIVAQRRHVSSKAVKIARDALEFGEEIAKGAR